MPSHNHTSSIRLQWYDKAGTGISDSYSTNTNAGVDRTTVMTGNSGSSQAHNNMPAYQTLYAWRRTA